MANKVRFALVGTGAIAPSYAQAFAQSEHAELVGVADIRTEAARELAKTAGCASYDSYDALAGECQFEAVILCTPPNTHAEISHYFLERRKHVLCEKPLSTNSKDARTMLETAKKAGVKLTMGSKFRYVDDVIRARSIVTSGILGEIILFENAFTSHVDMANRWNSNPAISGGGVLIDNGSHSVDLMRYFMGPVADVHAVEGKRAQGLPVEDTVRIFVRSVTGIVGNIDLSWSINKELDGYINIYGSKGNISIGWRESKYRQSSSKEWVVFGKGYNKVQAFRSQIDNFAKAIRGQDMLLITAKDAIASVEVIEAAYQSMRQSSWVPVSNGFDLPLAAGEELAAAGKGPR